MATPKRDESLLDTEEYPIEPTVHPQTDDPARVPLGAKVDADGVIHIGADGAGAS